MIIANLKFSAYFEVFYSLRTENGLKTLKAHHFVDLGNHSVNDNKEFEV